MATSQSKQDLLQQITEDEEDEARKSGEALGHRRQFTEFDCPTCTANNPHETFGDGEELSCSWCGLGFVAIVDDEGRLKLREE